MTAARGLKEYILSQDKDAVVEIADTIEYISPLLNKAITGGYVYMAKNTPKMYGHVYHSADKKTPINKTMELTTFTLRNKLLPLIEDFAPDVVITTHPFAAEILTALKRKGLTDVPIIEIVTDFEIHAAYINDGVDAYIVSSREMVDQVVERGVERVRVYPYGIPVNTKFLDDIDRETVFREEGLDPDTPTILIMAGSFGVTDILKIYHKIVKSPEDFQVIVITGKNEKLFETFERYLRKITLNNTLIEIQELTSRDKKPKSVKKSKKKKAAKPTKLLYFTDEVFKYMHMADLIVTKPGGLTVSESIAAGLPMAVFKAIPGQEEQNASFLESKGMAVRLAKDNTCTTTISRLMRDPEELNKMKQAIKVFSKGNSAAHVYKLMLDLTEKHRKKKEEIN